MQPTKIALLSAMFSIIGLSACTHTPAALTPSKSTSPVSCPASQSAVPKFVLINPNSNSKATTSMAGIAQNVAGTNAVIVEQTNSSAPSLLTTPDDMIIATKGVVEIGKTVAAMPEVQGIIVSAFSDPGLKELRATLPNHVPVVGIGEEAFHEAGAGGQPFAIVAITPDPALLASFKDKADELGYTKQYLGVVVTDGDPNAILKDEKRLDEALTKAVHEATAKGAKAIIMGGGPLSAPATRIQPNVKVPLVIAVESATRTLLKHTQEKTAAACQ